MTSREKELPPRVRVKPAVAIGLALGVVVLFLAAVYIPQWVRKQPGPAPAPAPAPITSSQSALRQTGWMGYAIDTKFSITAIAMDDRNADTVNLKSNLRRECTAIVLGMDNRPNDAAVTVTTDGAAVRLADGSLAALLSMPEVTRTDRVQYVAKYAAPFTVGARSQVEGKLVFLPAGLDMSRVQVLYLSVNGVKVSIPGRIFSAEEKARRLTTPGKQQDPSNL